MQIFKNGEEVKLAYQDGELIYTNASSGGGSNVWIIPKPDENIVGSYYIALAYGTLGADEASSDITIVYGDSITLANLSSTSEPRTVKCFTDATLTTVITLNNLQILGLWFGSLYAGTSIGSLLFGCYAFNQPLTIPSNVTSIGNYFMKNCYAFNQSLTIPSSVTSIGNYFLSDCRSFNKPLTIPSSVTSIGIYFMYNCCAFNQPLTIPNSVTNIASYFLDTCYSFNQLLTIPSSVTSIDGAFMQSCVAFNQPLMVPSSVTSIGSNFLNGCHAFNQLLTIPSSVKSIGSIFLSACYAFNQPLIIPSSVTSIGAYFMYVCHSMVSLLTYDASVYPNDTQSLATTSNVALTYTQGIPVVGTNAVGLLAALPNNSAASPYRNLRLA